MARMVRKQIYLAPHQQARLKALSRLLHVSEAELIRRALDLYLHQVLGERQERLQAWKEARALSDWWVNQGTAPGHRDWYREELYERPRRWPRS